VSVGIHIGEQLVVLIGRILKDDFVVTVVLVIVVVIVVGIISSYFLFF